MAEKDCYEIQTTDQTVSVVCPVFNSGNYLEQTLSSILEQDKLPEEIIFSDDGSTDGTLLLLEKWRCYWVRRIGYKRWLGPWHVVILRQLNSEWQ